MNAEVLISIVKQAGAIPFCFRKGKLNIFMITSQRTRQWIFPKGNVENGMTMEETAAIEALEEAGVTGEVLHMPVGKYTYKKNGDTLRVTLFPLFVTHVRERWDEDGSRSRKIVEASEAINGLLDNPFKRFVKRVILLSKKIQEEKDKERS